MLNILTRSRADPSTSPQSCHNGRQANTRSLPLVAIVGSPNVGKSVLFNILTGAYVTVSNYPGTTVEISRGKGQVGGVTVGVVDTPGMYRLVPLTEEERVARELLLEETPAVILHVVDAKNLERMLPMTLQLIEAGLPVMLVCNLMDEVERIGIKINFTALQQALGVPVIPTALGVGRGAAELQAALQAQLGLGSCKPCAQSSRQPARQTAQAQLHYSPPIEAAIAAIEAQLIGAYRLAKRAIAVLMLQEDVAIAALVSRQEGARYADIQAAVSQAQQRFNQPLAYVIARQQKESAQKILQPVLQAPASRPNRLVDRLSAATINPTTGLPILAVVLFMLYQLVGVLGAQTLVGFLEETVFSGWINPWVDGVLAAWVPWQALRDLIGGEYGLVTMGVRYAVAIILPIVGTFFLAFAVIEDSGYLPRLALLIDRVFKQIGLNGRAVIPMVLGFGCDTMATIVTRTLETRRERLLSTILLSLAIPCSAQLGVMLAMLAGRPQLLLIWMLVMGGVFLLVGWLAARLMPGERPLFYMELPPLRLPKAKNVLVKTYTRMEWYFREVFPMFLIASLVIWVGTLSGLFDLCVQALAPVMGWLGLPEQAAEAFFFGFFRRDFGAAGLYDLRERMSGVQILVAAITMTLFVPCVAQFAVTVKERGWKAAIAIIAFIFPFAFLVGILVSKLAFALGVA
jgi:ferrous iron transport protein B